MPDLVLVAKVVAAHGVKGAMKVVSFMSDHKNLRNYKQFFFSDGRELQLEWVSLTPKGQIAKFFHIKDRDSARAAVGTEIYITRSAMESLDQDTFYHCDLLGLNVRDDKDVNLGYVKAVQNFGAGDFLEIKSSEGAELSLPFNKEAVLAVNLKCRVIIVDNRYIC